MAGNLAPFYVAGRGCSGDVGGRVAGRVAGRGGAAGNLAQRQGQLDRARDFFTTATQRDPSAYQQATLRPGVAAAMS